MPKGIVKFFIFSLAAVMLLVFLNLIFKQDRLIVFISSPFTNIFFKTRNSIASGVNLTFNIKNILKENADLRSKNNALNAQLIGYSELEKENELLRNQLKMEEKKQFHLIEVKITSFDPNNLSKFAVINKGKNDGLENEMPVILPGNILLGKVFKAHDEYSTIILITDQNNKANVKSEIGDYNGILNGYLGKMLFMDMMEKNASVLKGDLILTSGIDGVYPENLIAGYVDSVKNDDNAVFQQAYLKSAFLPFRSNLAFVIGK